MKVDIAKINTLTISTTRPFTRDESIYIKALSYLFNCFNEMNTENSFSMYLSQSTFLLANKKFSRSVNPLVFVNQKGDILFDVDISVFNKAIKEFRKYIDYYDKINIPYEKKVQLAIKDYKNDKLDYYANSPVIHQSLIEKAEQLYDNYVR